MDFTKIMDNGAKNIQSTNLSTSYLHPYAAKDCLMQTPSPQSFPVYDQGSLKTFHHYKGLLENMKVKPINHTEITNGDPTSLEHLLWMCNTCIPMVRDDGRGFSVDKYSRWLGYIQGVLICKKITTVDAERDRVRGFMQESL